MVCTGRAVGDVGAGSGTASRCTGDPVGDGPPVRRESVFAEEV
jgi:hypothetical protein